MLNNPHLADNDRMSAGLEHVAFTYDTLDDLLATYLRLKHLGITPVLPIHHGMTMSLYYADPDGTQCELQVDVMDEATAAAFMASDVFAANPLGVPIDPDDLVLRRNAGVNGCAHRVRPDLTMPEADLVIVGCGPVGAMAALRARQHGLQWSSLLIVKARSTRGRAPSVWTMRSSDSLPLQAFSMDCDPAVRLSVVRSFSTIKATAIGIELPVGFVGPNGHPPVVALDQPAVERMLREAAIGAGADLRFGADVAALDGNKLTLSDGATITGRWVLGSDGARSTVRRQLGIELENQGFDEDWVVVDTTLLDPDLSLSSLVTQYCDPDRIVTYIPWSRHPPTMGVPIPRG